MVLTKEKDGREWSLVTHTTYPRGWKCRVAVRAKGSAECRAWSAVSMSSEEHAVQEVLHSMSDFDRRTALELMRSDIDALPWQWRQGV